MPLQNVEEAIRHEHCQSTNSSTVRKMYSTSQTLLLVLTFIIVEPVNMPTAMAVICNEASVKDFNHDELK